MTMLYRHKTRPEWGAAQLIAEANGKRTFLFPDRTQRTFLESHWNLMEPVGGEATETAPAAPSTAGAPGANDMRALAKHTRLLDDSGPAPSYREKLTEEPETGTYGNVGYWILRDVLEGWLLGERERFAPWLLRGIELIEHARRVGERLGGSVFYTAQQAEALALGYWLRGDLARSNEMFLAAANAGKEHFDANPKERRTDAGSLLLRYIAAGDPQRGLDAVRAVEIPRPRAHPEDPKTGRQNRHYDTYGRTLERLAEDLVKGAPRRAVYDRAMKYVAGEIADELDRNDYGFADIPKHCAWMKAFSGDVMGIADPGLALASIYLLAPSVRQPPGIARRIAEGPLPR